MRLFYERLNAIRDYHRRFPNAVDPAFAAAEAQSAPPEVKITFTEEEFRGRYVDLNVLHER